MEEMAVGPVTTRRAAGPTTAALAPRDLREWIAAVDKIGQLKRITEEVSRNEEMGAITYMAHQEIGAPALLFERIKESPKGFRALWNPIGSSVDRFALAMGEPPGLSVMELIQRCKLKFASPIPPVVVEGDGACVNENHLRDDKVDIRAFPAARHWAGDGGEYIGTCDAVITRDPDGGWLNVGTYRQMVQGKNQVGLYLSPGKDARLHIERYWSRNEPCEVVMCWGIDPAMFIAASQTFPKTVSELDYIGGIMGRPVELVKGEATSLYYPARAEIVAEGVLPPNSQKLEGPFGEFTGYYGRPEDYAFLVEIEAVHYRDNPILTHALMADYPANECALLYAVARSARIWSDLDKLGVPGIKGVYAHPAAAGGFGMTVVSLEQRYAGHAPQALAVAAQCPGGAYFAKWIIAVDEDVDPSNTNQVIWAMATRCNPIEDIDILRQTWSTWLDPAQNPPEERPYGSKALVNACMEHRYLKQFSKRTKVRRAVYEKVAAQWASLGFKGLPPKLWALED
ncbi:MAG: UbiD-type (de) carboxylyase-like protein [Candidatus Rokubacteria bacterium 13_1_40CM_69_27]|nr:MAG: UbiD-type (de) carboxylyase-like protein [Candidatus Rokubacteria bacterium 13_1_40CM_69_27]OLC34407.1 MAG: UbiD-type (de) carboxylyase-like protein [Candidatus Rokubacteria bacterium 13_1_40CM_4_69_5]